MTSTSKTRSRTHSPPRVQDGQGGLDTIQVTVQINDLLEAPSAPAAPTLDNRHLNQLTISWLPPIVNTGPAISDYDVRYIKQSEDETDDANWTDWDHAGTGLSATITGLETGTDYDIQVRAYNDELESPWSSPATFRTYPTVTVQYEHSGYAIPEGNSTNIKVKLDADPERDLTIPITKANQGGASNSDYSGVPANLTFAAGDTEQEFTFTTTDDSVDDDGESVLLGYGTLPTGVTVDTNNEATVSITDDDDPIITASFGQAAHTVAESDDTSTADAAEHQATITVTLSADPERTIAIPLITAGQGGANADDYSGVPDNVTFDAGETEQSFVFTATHDTLDDDGESVKITLGSMPDNRVSGTSPTETVISITDDDDPNVSASFSAATYSVGEGSSVTITITLSADPERTVTIPLVATEQGGAATADYSGIPASLVFNAGQTEQTFSLTATQDLDDDDDESVKITFGTLQSRVSSGATPEAVVSIEDDDNPRLTVEYDAAAYTVAEGASQAITVTLSAAPERDVTIPLTITNQSNASDADYSGVPANLQFNATQTSKSFTFTATQDNVDDDDEKVSLGFAVTLPNRITTGTNATSLVSITDDDVPTITADFGAATYSVAESDDPDTAEESENQVTVTVTLSADPERQVTIPLIVDTQGGASGADYSGIPPNVVFTSGETEQTFTFTATADTIDDDGESVKITFGARPTQVDEGATKQTIVSITDDDLPEISVSYGNATYSVDEGSTVAVVVTLSASPERAITVPITRVNQDGATGDDYSGVPASVDFAAGDTNATFTFSATEDDIDDDGESVKLAFSNSNLPERVTSATPVNTVVSINDDDDPHIQVSFASAAYSVVESDDPNTADQSENEVTITVTLDADPERMATIPLTITNLDGASNGDYSGIPAQVQFASGDTSEEFTFTATHDTLDDDDEKVKISLGTLPDRVTTGSNGTTTVSIIDDDLPELTVKFDESSYTAEEGDSVNVKVVLNAKAERNFSIPLTATNQSGATNDDYSNVPTSLAFGPEDDEVTFVFLATDDEQADNGESVKLAFGSTLPARVTATSPDTSTVNITNTDITGVTVSQTSLTIVEGGTGTYTIVLDTKPFGDVTITTGGLNNSELSVDKATLTFTPINWNTEQSVTVTAAQDDDTANEAAINVTHTATSADNGYNGVSVGNVAVSVNDDDVEGVSVSPTALSVTEGETATYTVVLTTEPANNVTITINDPTDNTDVTTSPASLTFTPANWESQQTVTVTAAHDSDDQDETATVTHTVANYAGATAADVAVTLDDDAPETVVVSFPQLNNSVTEGSSVDIVITLDVDPERTIVIPLTHPGGGVNIATADDYSGVPDTITFHSGDTSKTFTVTATDDTIDDDGERLTIAMGTLPADAERGAIFVATVSIVDNDDPDVKVSFAESTYTVAEGANVSVTVKLDADPERTVVIPLTKTNQDDTSDADYSGRAGQPNIQRRRDFEIIRLRGHPGHRRRRHRLREAEFRNAAEPSHNRHD